VPLRTFRKKSIRRLAYSLATYDSFPAFSTRVRRWFYNPLGVLLLASGAATLCGLYLHARAFALLGGLFLVITLGVVWPYLTLRGLRGQISFDRLRTSEGTDTGVCVRLTNRLPWTAYGLRIEPGCGNADGSWEDDSDLLGAPMAPGWRTISLRWQFRPARRGVYPLKTPTLASGFPFGLWKSSRALTIQTPLLVWPRTFAVMPAPQLSADQEIEGSRSPNKIGLGGDVLGVRPFRRGDSLRRIHWSQTARHDRLIVCEFQANARPQIQLILDLDPGVHSDCGVDNSREWAIRIVASLAKGWIEAGVAVGAVWHELAVPSQSGSPQINELLDSLARLPDDSATSLGDLLAQPVCRDFTAGLQIVVTTEKSLQCQQASSWRHPRRRWIVLNTHSFDSSHSRHQRMPRLPVQPWIWVDDSARIPALLRGELKEARVEV
jgi:uncharacterized protein (DUF58 family)